ncbi:MAG: hypothetical protein LBK95_19750 [Bifidobacteriaceae bacterium]|jgi:hypothetical protein|nr:hypothetical protein [Bifidobacteriaceae bacterium]
MTTLAEGQTRITLDLPQADYAALKIAAAVEGQGASMSSILRRLVREYLEDGNRLDDAYDLAMARARLADPRPPVPDAEVRARFETRRRASGAGWSGNRS